MQEELLSGFDRAGSLATDVPDDFVAGGRTPRQRRERVHEGTSFDLYVDAGKNGPGAVVEVPGMIIAAARRVGACLEALETKGEKVIDLTQDEMAPANQGTLVSILIEGCMAEGKEAFDLICRTMC